MLSYDRRAPIELMNALRPGGWAASLAEYARGGQYGLDLQLRGYEGKPRHWATLYVGLTKVLDLECHPKRGFRLNVHPTWKAYGWDARWEQWTSEGFEVQWPAVEDYLEQAIPAVGPSFLHEGAVQSAISAFRTRNLAVIDREVVIAFSNQPEKNEITGRLAGPLLAALDIPDAPPWWKGRPKSLGGECDTLAVDSDGSLMAIEIKPAKASSTIPWAPVQVRHYANLLNAWARSADNAASIIDGMVDQRVQLGLAVSAPPCATPVVVRPVVAVAHGVGNKVLDRMRTVHQLLVDAGLDDPPLEIYRVNLVGRLDKINL